MKRKALNPLDASWLYVESRDTPMHVAGLMIFELPKNAPLSYFQDLFKDSREHQEFYAPWNRRLRSTRLKNLRHEWIEEKAIDLDYHVRLSALPWPGGERELGILIARLHSRPLNFSRPPWECHVIQGLENNRFALYIKMHHALIDGISAMRLLERTLSKDPHDSELPAFWSAPPPARPPTPPLTAAADAVSEVVGGARRKAGSVPQLLRAIRDLMRAARDKADPMGVPFKAPRSMLNGRITGQRRFATQSFEMARVKKLAKAAGASLNDVVLALCSAALRRFLEEADALPAQPLTAGIPVSVRPADDQEQGNAISFIIASLASDVADPLERLKAIRASTRRAKEHLQSLPKSAIESYTMLLMGPYILQLLSGLGGRTRPVFNLTVSNVPGPAQALYLRGAKMVENYPVSLVTHGQAINITCQGYADSLNFGFVGCRDTLPHMQRIAVYTGEALEELEAAVYGR